MRLTTSLAALAATFVVASPAFAQAVVSDTATATARGVVLQQHSLINDRALDFGIVTTDGLNSGTVVIAANAAGTRTTGGAGGVTALPSAYSSARFLGLAAPNESVTLSISGPAGGVLNDASFTNTVTVNSLSLDAAGANRQADGNGNFTVYVGGDFGLSATQAAGVYSADFTVTAVYN